MIQMGPRELEIEVTFEEDDINPAFWEQAMPLTAKDNDEVVPCPKCGMQITFHDHGENILVACPLCHTAVFMRTSDGVVYVPQGKREEKTPISDDVSISGNPVNLTAEERALAERLLDW